jgi:hypothetical protein
MFIDPVGIAVVAQQHCADTSVSASRSVAAAQTVLLDHSISNPSHSAIE